MTSIMKKPYLWPAAGALVVVGYVLATNADPIVNGHRSYLLLYLGVAIVASFAIGFAFVHRATSGRLWLEFLGALPLALLAVAAWLLAPFGATEVALEAPTDSTTVVVTETSGSISLDPVSDAKDAGLIFQPGARVDARAYAHILLPVAESGYPVVIVKQPLGIAFLAAGFADSWARDHSDTPTWVVGGHSRGGVVASSNAEESGRLDGLLLWASFPASDISASGDLRVASVYGTNDELSTPEQVEASAEDLPPLTVFTSIEGAIHAFFGDYGEQPGDGEPGVSPEAAQAEIVDATLGFLAGLN